MTEPSSCTNSEPAMIYGRVDNRLLLRDLEPSGQQMCSGYASSIKLMSMGGDGKTCMIWDMLPGFYLYDDRCGTASHSDTLGSR